jgi:hypothetical protein
MSEMAEALPTNDPIELSTQNQIERRADEIHLERGAQHGDGIADCSNPRQELKEPAEDLFEMARRRFFTPRS